MREDHIHENDGVHEQDGSVLVHVPGGLYTMGANNLTEIEVPVHQVRLSPFLIGKYPVTNGQYRRFLDDNPGYRKPAFWGEDNFNQPTQPVVGVSWEDAMTYCNWAGLVLPTEAQWEAAARGREARLYPWGEDEISHEHASFGSIPGKTTPVGLYPAGAGPFGTLDMIGNVAEWCADVLDPDAYSKREAGELDPQVISSEPSFRVLRGGSWLDQERYLPAARRGLYWARIRRRFIGFRCAKPT